MYQRVGFFFLRALPDFFMALPSLLLVSGMLHLSVKFVYVWQCRTESKSESESTKSFRDTPQRFSFLFFWRRFCYLWFYFIFYLLRLRSSNLLFAGLLSLFYLFDFETKRKAAQRGRGTRNHQNKGDICFDFSVVRFSYPNSK